MNTITAEDLLRHLYGETSPQKAARIEVALKTDLRIQEEFEKLKATHRKLNEVHFSPRSQTIETIMQYAAKKQKQLHSI